MNSKLIRIHYLRSYLFAGTADVFLCDEYLTTLDSLWSDFLIYHYSYNDDYNFIYHPTISTIKYCQDQSNNNFSSFYTL